MRWREWKEKKQTTILTLYQPTASAEARMMDILKVIGGAKGILKYYKRFYVGLKSFDSIEAYLKTMEDESPWEAGEYIRVIYQKKG